MYYFSNVFSFIKKIVLFSFLILSFSSADKTPSLGSLKEVVAYIAGGGDINAKNLLGETLLHRAIVVAELDVISLLIKNGADIHVKEERKGSTPLHWAVVHNKAKVVRLLLVSGADIASVDNKGDTPLHRAAHLETWNNETDISEILLSAGADPNVKNKAGITPFHLVAGSRNLALLNLFIENKADVHLKIAEGEISYKEETSLYSEEEIPLYAKGETPLHISARTGEKDMAGAILTAGAHIDVKSDNGNTPLHLSASYGHYRVTRFFLRKGADINVQNQKGETPLHLATKNVGWDKALDVTDFLLRKKADVNIKDKEGQSPLHLAVSNLSLKLVYQFAEFAEKKADNTLDFNILDKKGNTPLHLALLHSRLKSEGTEQDKEFQEFSENNRVNIISKLLEMGASASVQNQEGKSAIDLAKENDRSDLVKLLEERADPASACRQQFTN